MLLKPVLIAVFCSLIGALAQILLKKGTVDVHSLFDIVFNKYIIVGAILYVLAFGLYLFAIRSADVSIIYPVIALSYLWVVLFAKIFLDEPLSFFKLLGTITIIVGVSLVVI